MASKPRAVWPMSAKAFHWVTALAVALMLGSGLVMTYRGHELNIWDGLTNALYSSHKLLGFALLWFTLARLANRLVGGTPADAPSLSPGQRVVAAANHAGLYALLIAMPLLGWLAVSLFPALTAFGITLPALAEPDREAYETVIGWHRLGAYALGALLAVHVTAALFHIVRCDGIGVRMGIGRR